VLTQGQEAEEVADVGNSGADNSWELLPFPLEAGLWEHGSDSRSRGWGGLRLAAVLLPLIVLKSMKQKNCSTQFIHTASDCAAV
jgi:hypothetical protein